METGFDAEGPYDEVPSEKEADNPKPAIPGWQNTSLGDLRASAAWGESFCTSHHTGYWCSGSTRVRCCKKNGVGSSAVPRCTRAGVAGEVLDSGSLAGQAGEPPRSAHP